MPTPVTDGTYLYVVNDRGIMCCLDAKTGKEIYGRQRLRPATYSGSPVLADGKIYVTNEDGVTSVVKAGPKFELLAENDFDDYTLSSPAISDGQIFIRTTKFLYAIGPRRVEARLKYNFVTSARGGRKRRLPANGFDARGNRISGTCVQRRSAP